MKFITATILSALLCGEAVLGVVPADRRLARRESRLGRRSSSIRRTLPFKQAAEKYATVESNWGGAILEGSGFTAASAVANVPEGGGGSNAAGSAWVGIDGATCDTAILQTGFDWYGDGTFDAWYEWYPQDAYSFSGITIAEGDSIEMSVVATSKTTGTASLENLTTGQKVSHTFTGGEGGSLCETSAEFIIEDFEECNASGSDCQPVTFASFTPAITFSECSATKNGKTVGLSGAEISEVIVNNKDLTSCSVSGSTTLTCSYV